MWCWRSINKIISTDNLTNEDVLRRINDESSILTTILRRIVRYTTSSTVNQREPQVFEDRRRIQLINDLKQERKQSTRGDADQVKCYAARQNTDSHIRIQYHHIISIQSLHSDFHISVSRFTCISILVATLKQILQCYFGCYSHHPSSKSDKFRCFTEQFRNFTSRTYTYKYSCI